MPDNDTEIDGSKVSGTAASHGGGGLGLGDRLRSARKAKAISLESVAEALHLDESVVLHLEEERFDELGAPVFVRGHLKAYAKLVGLSPDVVLDAYRETEPPAPAVPPVERQVRRSVAINPIVWGFSALVLLLGLVLSIYVMQDDEDAPVKTAAPAAAMPETVAASPVPVPVPVELPAPVSTTAGSTPAGELAKANEVPPRAPVESDEPVVAAAPAVAQAPAPTVIADESVETTPPPAPVTRPQADVVRLSLHFREESWVEISDANQRLLFGLQREGRRRELSGEPPFRLLLGNAAGVDLSVNDEPFAVPASGVTGKVARFEISATASE